VGGGGKLGVGRGVEVEVGNWVGAGGAGVIGAHATVSNKTGTSHGLIWYLMAHKRRARISRDTSSRTQMRASTDAGGSTGCRRIS
jgi:hypothetical protein